MDNQITPSAEEQVQNQNQQDPSDRLTPDHPRFKDVLSRAKNAEEKAAQLEEKVNQLLTRVEKTQEEPDDLDDSDLKTIGRIDSYLRDKKGYMTREDYEREQSTRKMAEDLYRLSEKYNGENGMPKFVPDEVTAYYKKYGSKDLEKAYQEMHFDTIVELKAKQLSQGIRPPRSERPTGIGPGEQAQQLTPEEIKDMSMSDYLKNREKIHQAMRGR